MGLLMGQNSVNKNDMGFTLQSKDSLEVSIYPKGDPGVTFVPSIQTTEDEVTGLDVHTLQWENNGGLVNPNDTNLGVTFVPSIQTTETECNLSWANNGNLTNPETINIKGDAATIQIGKVEHNPAMSVKNVGTENAAIFDFGLPGTNLVLNGAEAGLDASVYAPSTGGTAGQVLKAGGSGIAPYWENQIDAYTKTESNGRYYTKTQMDTKLNTKQNILQEGTYVSFEENGNTTTINVLYPKATTELDGIMSKEDKQKLDSLEKVEIEVIDNLTSTSTTKPLSANQGKILNDKLNNLSFTTLTKSEYNALAAKDANTLYIIREM